MEFFAVGFSQAKIVNYYAVVFLLRTLLGEGKCLQFPEKRCPHKVRRDSESQGDGKKTTRSKFTTHSIFSTAGSFGDKEQKMGTKNPIVDVCSYALKYILDTHTHFFRGHLSSKWSKLTKKDYKLRK